MTVAGEVSGEIGRGMLVLSGRGRWRRRGRRPAVGRQDRQPENFRGRAGEDESGAGRRGRGHAGREPVHPVGRLPQGPSPLVRRGSGPELAEQLYQVFVEAVAEQGITVATGRFRQHMEVELTNDGPVTLLVESK